MRKLQKYLGLSEQYRERKRSAKLEHIFLQSEEKELPVLESIEAALRGAPLNII